MRRLAKLLAAGEASPCLRDQMTEALINGDFSVLLSDTQPEQPEE